MNIGRPKRIIEVQPTSLPLPEPIEPPGPREPLPETLPTPDPAPAPVEPSSP